MLYLGNTTRCILALLGFLSAIFFPPYVPLAVMGLLALRFRAWEVLLIGLCIDFVWLPAGLSLHPLPLFTIGAFILVWALEPIRKEFLLR